MSSDLDELQAALVNEPRPADAPITRDLPCLRCGYNLRSVAENGSCPECGSPVGMSIHGDRLHYADPVWLATVRRGLILMALSTIGWLPLMMVVLLAAALLNELGMPKAVSIFLLLLVPVVYSTMLTIGAFKMTAAEPRVKADEAPMTLRRFVRCTSVLAGIAVPAYWLNTMGNTLDGTSPDLPPGVELALRLGLLSIPAMIYGCLLHLRKLAFRLPDPTLVTSTSIVLAGLPASIVIYILLPRGWHTPTTLVGFSIGIFSLWTLVIIWLFAVALHAPAQAARRNARKGIGR